MRAADNLFMLVAPLMLMTCHMDRPKFGVQLKESEAVTKSGVDVRSTQLRHPSSRTTVCNICEQSPLGRVEERDARHLPGPSTDEQFGAFSLTCGSRHAL